MFLTHVIYLQLKKEAETVIMLLLLLRMTFYDDEGGGIKNVHPPLTASVISTSSVPFRVCVYSYVAPTIVVRQESPWRFSDNLLLKNLL